MLRLLTMLAVTAALTTVAGAQERVKEDAAKPQQRRGFPQGQQLARLLERADADGNGQVTKDELAEVAPRLANRGFQRLDADNDGVISEKDLAKRRGNGPTPQQIRKADANKDGQWSFEELKTAAPYLNQRIFAAADRNGDDLLTRKELEGLRRQTNQRNNNRRRNNPNAQVRRDAVAKLLQADANQDGEVSYDELLAAKPGYPREAFNRNDRNNDGVVSNADAP